MKEEVDEDVKIILKLSICFQLNVNVLLAAQGSDWILVLAADRRLLATTNTTW